MENLLIIFENPFYVDIHLSYVILLCLDVDFDSVLLGIHWASWIFIFIGFVFSYYFLNHSDSSSLSLLGLTVCLLACLMVFHRTLAYFHFSSIFGLFLKFDNFHCPMLSDSFFCILKSPYFCEFCFSYCTFLLQKHFLSIDIAILLIHCFAFTSSTSAVSPLCIFRMVMLLFA